MTLPSFSDLTTIKVGGPIEHFLTVTDFEELVEQLRECWAEGLDWLILGGGSNLVAASDPYPGRVFQLATSGIHIRSEEDGRVTVRVAAGENWDDVVAWSVAAGLSGIEALSGIPGKAGAAPVQNIGAYGQEIADVLVAVTFYDHLTGEVTRIAAKDLGLSYRTSIIKQGRQGVVCALEIALTRSELSQPIRYAQLATNLGVAAGCQVKLAEVREAVLSLRASKGMLLSDTDPDSVSAGSFFTNPIVSERFAVTLPAAAPRFDAALPENFETPEPLVKLSAAWLIENSGITRGFRLPGSNAAVSSKHTLAIVNSGGATGEQVAELARYIHSRVLNEFGVGLQAEPKLLGLNL